MAGIESCQEVYGEREMRPARRFTGKGDETCQEVYGEREMRPARRFTGKGR
jgi:hypothetical protein